MDLLLDTQVLVWMLNDDRRLSSAFLTILAQPETQPVISAVTAWEFSDLRRRRRLPVIDDIAGFMALYGATLADFRAVAWTVAEQLPDFHRDPVDRMLIAHAITADMTLVTADETMRRYPVKTLW